MATQEVIVDQKPVDTAPIDPNVVIPKHVAEAAARAEAIYQQAYPTAENPPVEVPPEQVPPTAPEAAPAAAAAPPPPPPAHDVDWEQRYNSMKGRWQANERMMGEMRSQMDQMAAELQRSQDLMRAPPTHEPQQSGQVHENLITPEERDTYGDEMLNVARKVAIEALQPEIQRVQAQNEELKKELLKQGQRDLLVQLSGAVPNWRSIVTTNEWKDWLRLPNVYTGEVRGRVLDAAHKAANAPRVIAIFNEYVRDTIATGGQLPGTQANGQLPPQEVQPPREPAIPMASIAAPGRARPSSGEIPTATADKPTYTRQQIAKFYADSRRGAYSGRETDKNRIEADIIAAQSEGRVR